MADIEAGIEALKKIAGRTRSLDRIMPINPTHDLVASETFETELAAAAKAEAVEAGSWSGARVWGMIRRTLFRERRLT